MFPAKTVLSTSVALAFALASYAASAAAPYATTEECLPGQGEIATGPNGNAEQDRERIIAVEQLPAAAHATLMGLGKGIEVKQVEENSDGGRTTYEIDLVLDNVYYDVEIGADGKILSSEIEAWIVSLESLPAAARTAVELEAAGAAIKEVRQEQEDNGEIVYDIDIQNSERLYALRIDARGGLIERDITLSMLPPGAYNALLREAQGGSIVELDEEMHDGRLSYEANIVIGSVELEISVDENGVVVKLDL